MGTAETVRIVAELPVGSAWGPHASSVVDMWAGFASNLLEGLARPRGVEPLTPRSVVWCSIQLSYGRMLPNVPALGRSQLLQPDTSGKADCRIAQWLAAL